MPIVIDNSNSVLSTTGAAHAQLTGDTLYVTPLGYLISTVSYGLVLGGTTQTHSVYVEGMIASTAADVSGISVYGSSNTVSITVAEAGTVRGADGQDSMSNRVEPVQVS